MPQYTQNYNLYRPSRNDKEALDNSLDNNFKKIDEELKKREDGINETKTQLAENVTKLNGLERKSYTERKPYYTLIDDDGTNQFKTILKPLLDQYGLKCTLAINPGMVGTGDRMGWADIELLASQGFEIVNHGWMHEDPANLTIEQLKSNYELEKQAFIDHGLTNYDYFVYPNVMDWKNTELINKIQQVYKCCYANTDAPDNYLPFDPYVIKRPYIADQTTTIQEINKTIENVGYCALFGHAWMTTYNTTYLKQNLQYLVNNSSKITYATVKDMIDNFGAIIHLGNVGGDNFTVDKNGNVDFSVGGKKLRDLTNVNITSLFNKDTLISGYRKNSLSISRIIYADATSLGLPDVGTVKTFRFDGDNNDYHAYQEYSSASNLSIYRRRWLHNLGRWEHFFSPVSGVNVTTVNRPKHIYQGGMIFDTTLLKPLWARRSGFNVNPQLIARNTAYTVGQYVYTGSSSIYRCSVAGTTADVAPAYNEGTVDVVTNDGTAQFKWVGLSVQWNDATGTQVS